MDHPAYFPDETRNASVSISDEDRSSCISLGMDTSKKHIKIFDSALILMNLERDASSDRVIVGGNGSLYKLVNTKDWYAQAGWDLRNMGAC